MELQGRIKVITPVQTFGANGFQKRELIIVTEEQYPQTISIDFTQGNCELLNGYQVGQVVKVTFDIRGREWTNPQGEVKYFNSLVAWRRYCCASCPCTRTSTSPTTYTCACTSASHYFCP